MDAGGPRGGDRAEAATRMTTWQANRLAATDASGVAPEPLNLRGLRLNSLPDQLPEGVEELDLGGNRLTSVPPVLPQGLRSLNLSWNSVSRVPQRIPASLTHLNLSGNVITRLGPDSSFAALGPNCHIDLDSNPLNHDEFVRLEMAMSLPDYNGAEFSYSGMIFGQATRDMMETGSLAGVHGSHAHTDETSDTSDTSNPRNAISALDTNLLTAAGRSPSVMARYSSQLSSLSGSSAFAMHAAPLGGTVETGSLQDWVRAGGPDGGDRAEASRRMAAWLNDAPGAARAPQALNLSGLRLTTLPEALPAGIQALNLRGNRLASVPSNLPEGLVSLNMRQNYVARLPERIPASLTHLDLSYNEITRIWPDAVLARLGTHCEIDLSGNALNRDDFNRLFQSDPDPERRGPQFIYN